jgi:hypothetical protein
MRVCQACVHGFEGIGLGTAPGSADTGGLPVSLSRELAARPRTDGRVDRAQIHHITAIVRSRSAGGTAFA